MARIFILCVLIVGLVLTGCSKKEDEIKALEQDATGEDAAAVMDSLESGGPTEAAPAVSEPAPDESAVQAEAREQEPDYSQIQGFVIQLGSYRNYELASYMAEKYENREFPAFLSQIEIEGQLYYRLRIGVYDTYQEAKEVGELMVDRYSASYWIDNNR